MRWLIIVLVLVSFGSVCMAGAGDVYFCQVEKNMAYEKDRIIRGGQFKFKFKQTKIEIIFFNPSLKNTSGHVLNDLAMPIYYQWNEAIKANSIRGDVKVTLKDGFFHLSVHQLGVVKIVTATCSKF